MASIFDNYVQQNLLTGPALLLYAPLTVARPTKIQDILAVKTPYALTTGWLPFGATNEAPEYERDMDSEELYIQQTSSAILNRITEVTRTFTATLTEHTPEIARIAEEGAAIETIAGGANTSAQKAVAFGAIESTTRYRIAAIMQRDPGLGGLVTESTAGLTRGAFVALVLNSASIAADGSSVEIDREDWAGRELAFSAYPDTAVTNAQEAVGRWIFENSTQTIASV